MVSQDLRIRTVLYTAEIDKNGGKLAIPPNESKTYYKYFVIEGNNLKYGTVFVLPPTFEKVGLLSKDEQKQKMIQRHEWILIQKKI